MSVFLLLLVVLLTQSHAQTTVNVTITFIEDAVAKGAVCLDGSPGAYFFHKGSGDGVDKLAVYLVGGGWCEKKETCLVRSMGAYGSTKGVTTQSFGQILSPNGTVNPDFYLWNKMYIPYCDGASYMADVAAAVPIQGTNLYLRGGRIFKAAVEEVLAKQELLNITHLRTAMLVGNSAGGLAAMLNCDRFRSFLPTCATNVKCVADSAFFLDAKFLPGADKRESYYNQVITFHELATVLPAPCTSRMDPKLCLFPEYFIGDIQTPLFVLNSAFDQFQIKNKLETPRGNHTSWTACLHNVTTCRATDLQYMQQFRTTLLDTLKRVDDLPSGGTFISSCYIHDFLYKEHKWSTTPVLANKTIAKAIGDWFFNRDRVRLVDESDTPIICGDD